MTQVNGFLEFSYRVVDVVFSRQIDKLSAWEKKGRKGIHESI